MAPSSAGSLAVPSSLRTNGKRSQPKRICGTTGCALKTATAVHTDNYDGTLQLAQRENASVPDKRGYRTSGVSNGLMRCITFPLSVSYPANALTGLRIQPRKRDHPKSNGQPRDKHVPEIVPAYLTPASCDSSPDCCLYS